MTSRLLAVVVSGGAIWYMYHSFFHTQLQSIVFPKCIFYMLTGLQCPGCGGQRAFYSLINGNVKLAFSYNAYVFFAVPYAISVAYSSFTHGTYSIKLKKLVQSTNMVYAFLFITITWWIIRNLL